MAKDCAFSVFYYSKGGNTKKVAEAMASALKAKALDVKKACAKDVPKGAFIIAGSGVYANRVGREMMDFLQSLPQVKGGKAATFETSGNGERIVTGKEMGEMLAKRGYSIKGSFVCPGRAFFVAKRGHPSAEDLRKAAEFAKGLSAK
jgi:flavodoxin I